MRFAFIQAHARLWHIVTMCRVPEVSKAGYYAWVKRPLCQRVATDRVLTAKIQEIQRQGKQRYGSPRVRMELRALGVACGKHRVARLMRSSRVSSRRAPKNCSATTCSREPDLCEPRGVRIHRDLV